jgi:hypothetical protein
MPIVGDSWSSLRGGEMPRIHRPEGTPVPVLGDSGPPPEVLVIRDVVVTIAIDPGASGGICCLKETRVLQRIEVLSLCSMPDKERFWSWFTRVIEFHKGRDEPMQLILERVTGYIPPRKGTEEEEWAHHGQPGSAMFEFGRNFGALEAFIIASGCFVEGRNFEVVSPNVWQRGLGIEKRRAGEDKKEFKRRLRDFADKLFPGHGVTLSVCDALLLAEYKRRNGL